MADLEKTIQIIFGTTDDTAAGIAGVKANLDILDDAVQGAAAPFAKLADGILAAETALLAMGAAMVTVSISQAGQFSESVTEIGTLFGANKEQVGQFSEEILAYAQTSTRSIEDINKAVYTAVSGGIAYADSLDFLSVAEKAATAGRADLEATTKVLVSTLNAYGLSTDDATRVSDLLFTTVKDGLTTLPELADSISRVTGSAAAANIPIETMFAAIAAGTGYGLQTSQVVSGLAQVIQNIVKPSQQASDEAARLGIGFSATAIESKGLEGVLADVARVTEGNTSSFALLFGSMEAYNLVAQIGKDSSGLFAKALEDMRNSAGATQQAFELMSTNMSLVNQNIINNLRAVLIGVGLPLLEQYGNAGLALADIFKGIKIGIDEGQFDPVLDQINLFGEEAARIFSSIAENLPQALGIVNFEPLTNALQSLGGEMREVFIDIFGEIDITTPEGLAVAIQKAINLLSNLTSVVTGIVDSFEPVFQAIGELGNETADQSAKTSELIGQYLGYTKALVDFGSGLGAVVIIAKETGTDLRGFVDIILGSIKVMINGFQVGFDTVTLTVVETLRQLSDAAANTADILGFEDLAAGFRTSAIEMASIGEQLQADITRNGLEAREGLNQIGDGFSEAFGAAEPAAQGVVDSAVKVKEAATSMTSSIYDLSKQITTTFDDTGAAVATVAAEFAKFDENGNIIATAKNGIETFGVDVGTVFATLDENIKKAGENTKGYVTTWENGIPTFSQVTTGIGGISQKFQESAKSAEDAVTKSEEYRLKMEQIASDERIAVIKGTFELNIAKLQADAEVAVSIIEGLSTTITSTGELLGNLFGLLADEDLSFSSMFDIQRQIDLENRIRQQAADDQHELAQAQVATYQAQIDSLRSGTPLFNVNADGVEPELRQLLFKLLQLIQIEASGSYGNFLLAVTP